MSALLLMQFHLGTFMHLPKTACDGYTCTIDNSQNKSEKTASDGSYIWRHGKWIPVKATNSKRG